MRFVLRAARRFEPSGCASVFERLAAVALERLAASTFDRVAAYALERLAASILRVACRFDPRAASSFEWITHGSVAVLVEDSRFELRADSRFELRPRAPRPAPLAMSGQLDKRGKEEVAEEMKEEAKRALAATAGEDAKSDGHLGEEKGESAAKNWRGGHGRVAPKEQEKALAKY